MRERLSIAPRAEGRFVGVLNVGDDPEAKQRRRPRRRVRRGEVSERQRTDEVRGDDASDSQGAPPQRRMPVKVPSMVSPMPISSQLPVQTPSSRRWAMPSVDSSVPVAVPWMVMVAPTSMKPAMFSST